MGPAPLKRKPSPFRFPGERRVIIKPRRRTLYGQTKVIIMGAAGRDFHNFNMFFRNNEDFEVVAFTATPDPGHRRTSLPRFARRKGIFRGIPIFAESELPTLIKKHKVDEVIFAYSLMSPRVRHEQGIDRQRLRGRLQADGCRAHDTEIEKTDCGCYRGENRIGQEPNYPPCHRNPASPWAKKSSP
ncbi:MAG: hypothetical protein MZV63_63400 [Marinilabiliales bacterium]|nr:hypothetical protein [Marinilabiliales bacterium]